MLDLLVFGSYLAALLVIGRLTSRRIGTAEDFHLCGRSLTRLPAALGLAATEFSGSGLIGGAGLAYAIGVSGAYWNLTAVPAWLLIGVTIAPRLRRMTLDTVPGYLGARYGMPSRRLVALLQIVESVVFTAVQIMVSAIAVSTLFPVNVTLASLLVTAAFVAYTAMGGLWAVVWTDVLQYVILMTGILVGLPLALDHVGGIAGLQAALPSSYFDAGRLGVMEPLAWMALCVYSYSTDQTYLQRVFATRDPKVARFAYLYTGINYLIFGVCVAGMGMVAAVLLPGLPNQDEALPRLIADVLPRGLRGFFLTAILATTMSTAAAWLAAGASLVVQDGYEPLVAGRLDERRLLRVSRLTIVVLAALALSVALSFPGVVNAVVFSTLVAPAAVFVPMMIGLYWKKPTGTAGFCALLAAAVVGVVSQALWYRSVPGWLGAIHPLFLGPLAGLVVLLGVVGLQAATRARVSSERSSRSETPRRT